MHEFKNRAPPRRYRMLLVKMETLEVYNYIFCGVNHLPRVVFHLYVYLTHLYSFRTKGIWLFSSLLCSDAHADDPDYRVSQFPSLGRVSLTEKFFFYFLKIMMINTLYFFKHSCYGSIPVICVYISLHYKLRFMKHLTVIPLITNTQLPFQF